MKKLLITGFEPFGGQKINPSWECVCALNDIIGEFSLEKLQIPTVFEKAFLAVESKANEIMPDAILCVGQAGGRRSITPEAVAINLKDANIFDNEGNMPRYEKICLNGENAYFTTLPITRIVEKVKSVGVNCAISYSAGAFVCNETLYRLLCKYSNTNVQVGFIHVPFAPNQTEESNPSMSIEDMVKGLTAAITAL